MANGVTINGATVNAKRPDPGPLECGETLTMITNRSANPISGTFSNLPDGAIVTVDGNNFQASYSGGDGNDLPCWPRVDSDSDSESKSDPNSNTNSNTYVNSNTDSNTVAFSDTESDADAGCSVA